MTGANFYRCSDYNPVTPLKSSAGGFLTGPGLRSRSAEGAFSYLGPVLQNKLPADLRSGGG